jgi:hypothetical protein
MEMPLFRQRSRAFEMSGAGGPAGQEFCVLYREAISWIAFRNFGGWDTSIGPRLLRDLPRYDDDSDDEVERGIGIGRYMLAQSLLLDYARKRRIRIYANGTLKDKWAAALVDENIEKDEEDVSSPIQLTADFLIKAELDFHEYEGPTLFVREERAYTELAVNYDDLMKEFWGNDALPMSIQEIRSADRNEPAFTLPGSQDEAATLAMPLKIRGRRPRYPWPDFMAELVAELHRRSISGPPVANQAEIERQMLDWCTNKWGAEPAVSQIREWVGPTFRAIFRSPVSRRATNGTADNLSPRIADAADG